MRCYKFDLAWRITGLDRAVAYTVSARLLQIVGSVGTVLLILRFLTPVEQGYYYTLLSLAALQVIFELGFSFVILQLSAHESALLTIGAKGDIGGNPAAFARLAAVLRMTVKWYSFAAVLFTIALLPAGYAFFNTGDTAAGAQVPWLGPWIATVLGVAGTLFMTPLYSFVEGCRQVHQVARLRMWQALIVFLCSWVAIAAHCGLYACAFVNIGACAVGAGFLLKRLPLLATLWRQPVNKQAISWQREVLPFQWKIAVSWLCSYFTLQVFTPILFASRGALEAGRMGLSLSIAGYMPVIALCWISPKAAPFGQLVRAGLFAELDKRFSRAFIQALAVMFVLNAMCLSAVIAARYFLPAIAARMAAPRIFVLLLAAGSGSFVIQAMAVYLRSFKREPLLVQSIAVSLTTVLVVPMLVHRYGGEGVAAVYFAATCLVGLPWAWTIFRLQKASGTVPECAEVSAEVA
jgi:hypothetical protein